MNAVNIGVALAMSLLSIGQFVRSAEFDSMGLYLSGVACAGVAGWNLAAGLP